MLPSPARRPSTPVPTGPVRRLLAWTTAAALLTATSPAFAQADAPTTEDGVQDPKLAEAANYFREAERLSRRGKPVAAADLYIAAYELLDDPRKYRNDRGTALTKIYNSLLLAYEAAANDAAKIDRACRLRNLMISYLADLKSGYGEASEDFQEVHIAREKLRGLDLMTAAHGDPETLCADEPERKRVAMLGPASLGPASLAPQRANTDAETDTTPPPETSTSSAASGPGGPLDDDFDAELEPARDRRRIALTAVGGTAIGLGAASLGVMALYLSRGTQNSQQIQAFRDEVMMNEAPLSEADKAKSKELDRDGQRYDTLALATGIAGGAALLTGVIMTAVGGKRLRSRQVSMAPNASMTSLGATLHLRF